MMGVNIPKKKQSNNLANIGTIGGAIAGGVFTGGSPAGMAAGASLGGMAGGMAQGQQKEGPEAIPTGPSDAMSRRMSKLDDNPQSQIRQSIDSLKFIEDPAQRAELAKPLMQAQQMARMKGPQYG